MTVTIENISPSTAEGILYKTKLLESIKHKFKDVENNKILSIPTILDPRFKRMHFQNALSAAATVEQINKEMKVISTINKEIEQPVQQEFSDITNQYSIWKTHDNLVAKSTNESMDDDHLLHELRQYLKQPVIARHNNPFQHWKTLKYSFPTLYELAIRYMSIISTSVPSESKFSEAGTIKNHERNRITGEHLNQLLFMGSLSKEEWNLT
ncbi:PREDICTED: zinc finger BED domain-containing protein 4-like [Cyphomyrmex costatus]|nr:PREDICTED: zinc finger BED domain-containing protein 4-like [Cyphomyrmex costatus]